MSEAEVRKAIEAAIVKSGSLRQLAKEWGVSPSVLSDVVTGRRAPSQCVLTPLGLVARVTVEYVPGDPPARRTHCRRATD